MGCFVWGVKKMAWDVLSRDVLSSSPKQIAPTSFKQKVIMLNRQFQTEWNSFKQDPKKTAAIFLKFDAGEVRTRGPSNSSQAFYH